MGRSQADVAATALVAVLACGVEAGLETVPILNNDQKFTKTANCWGVDNNSKGTNTNRVVVFRKAK